MKKIFKRIISNSLYLDHLYQLFSTYFYYRKIKNTPFCAVNNNNEKIYFDLFDDVKNLDYKEVAIYENKSLFKIDKKWLNDLALITQITIKNSNLCYAHGRIIYSCLASYLSNKDEEINIIETGTSKGFSSLCMAKALNDLNKRGKISTIDILPKNKKIFWNSISDIKGKNTRLELLNKWKDLTQKYIDYYEGFSKQVLKKYLNLNRIHFAFLDGSHTYSDVGFEFKFVSERQLKNDIIIVDDYNIQYPGLIEAVNQLSKSFDYTLEFISSEKDRTYVICIRN